MLALEQAAKGPIKVTHGSRIEVVCLTPKSTDQASLRSIFSHTNWRVIWCETIDRALRCLEEYPAAVLVLDSELDETACRDALARVSALEGKHHTLVLTSNIQRRHWEDLIDAGAFDVLLRPLDPREVLHLVSFAWQLSTPVAQAKARAATV
jgi:DNA-binding response OmpR family regulator